MNSTFDFTEIILQYEKNVFHESSESSFTYSSFFKKVQSVAVWLGSQGVKKNEIVILKNTDVEIYPILIFALWKIGAVVFPVNPKIPSASTANVIDESNAAHVIGEKAEELKESHFIDCTPLKQLSFNAHDLLNYSKSMETPALIIMTSGSSGKPKYALHTFRSLYYNAVGVNSYFNLTEDDHWLVTLPFYHVGGLGILLRCFLAGARYSLLSPGRESLNNAINKRKPTHISLVFTQLQRLLENRKTSESLKACKAVFLGGSAIPGSVIDHALSLGINLYSGYGLTEMGSTVAIRNHKTENKDVAEILKHREVKVLDNEILLRGKCLFAGYQEKGGVNLPLNNDWFHTGDLGILKNDKITVTGRKDNMFISGGENIQPEEIEKTLLNLDGIEQALVVPCDNKEYGQRPCAFIKYSEGIDFDEKKIRDSLKIKLPSFKIPDKILQWPEQVAQQSQGSIKVKRSWFIEYASGLCD
ncbi:MAG: o-succinylbenzoate--CoA ligase [Calditrichaeota bacterium]|nr:o-succinylbenzoate--CoA ligase [Calditrichota bacterium]